MENGTLIIYVREDGGLVTDTGVYLSPGEDNVATVGKDISAEMAQAYVERGWCAVYTPAALAPPEPAGATTKPSAK